MGDHQAMRMVQESCSQIDFPFWKLVRVLVPQRSAVGTRFVTPGASRLYRRVGRRKEEQCDQGFINKRNRQSIL